MVQAMSERRLRGFSLLEVLAVVTVMGILASVVVTRIATHGMKAKQEACRGYKADINKAIERYHFDLGVWATDLDDLEHPDYYPQEIPNCPVTESAYTIDTSTHRISGHNH